MSLLLSVISESGIEQGRMTVEESRRVFLIRKLRGLFVYLDLIVFNALALLIICASGKKSHYAYIYFLKNEVLEVVHLERLGHESFQVLFVKRHNLDLQDC